MDISDLDSTGKELTGEAMPETAIPKEDTRDSTLAFFSEGYRFISNRCARMNTDVFDTRIMFKKATCVMGEDAARMFYHPDRFTRRGAIPPTTVKLLQDKGSVQTLSGNPHRHRKIQNTGQSEKPVYHHPRSFRMIIPGFL